MMPLRIRLVRTRWSHWGAHAGIVRFADFLPATEFAVEDNTTPFTPDGMDARRRDLGRMAARVLRSRMPWYTSADLRAEAATALRTIASPAAVLHFLDPEHGMQFLPAVIDALPRGLQPRMVATFHQPAELLHELVPKDIVQRLDAVTLVSPTQRQFFTGWYPEARTRVILHGIDAEFFHPTAGRRTLETWTCLTVGHYLRDFEAVRAVAERVRGDADIRFRVVSPGPTGLDDLPNVLVERGLSDEALRAAYQNADVLLLPLKDATANNALLEAFACALPVVTTDLMSTRAYAGKGEALLVSKNDPDLILQAITRLRRDAELRHRLGCRARRRAVELEWRNVAPMYAALYRDLADGSLQ